MPRFYFHIRDGEKIIADMEGIEMKSARAALEEAKAAAREILASKGLRNEVIDGQEFEVQDVLGTTLFTVPYKSVLKLE
ncbi:hypothetical protein IHQ71_31675 (plasmid) [Rhizobium sp. TH2]|uniref:DUF6894 family protein n=1 Tax=Rhizobium sp. TH2 TaxID=2775403 RepID=UPI002158192D|nr:hypothetical protein [Rhizobium sp. TH2]UVC12629.1 hypothetical protein IHQ71_31675 [Rhizobium sp. TH2]